MGILLTQPNCVRYFVALGLVRLGGNMFNVAIVLLVFARTHSLALGGLTVAAGTFSAALTGPLLGAWLDVTRSRRRLFT
jgi:hypothetical protein